MILEQLRVLAAKLAEPSRTMREMAAEVGKITGEYEYNMLVQPRDPDFKQANIVRGANEDAVTHISLTLNEPLMLAQLEAEFGDYTELPPMPNEPESAVFKVYEPSGAYGVTLIASVEDTTVTQITLRRD